MWVTGKIMSPSLASKPTSLIRWSRGLQMGTGHAGGAPKLGHSPSLPVSMVEAVELGSSTAVVAAAVAPSPFQSSILSSFTSVSSLSLASWSLCQHSSPS